MHALKHLARNYSMVATAMLATVVSTSHAETLDNFLDGSAVDGDPIEWLWMDEPVFGQGTFDVIEGDLIVSPSTRYLLLVAGDNRLDDLSLQTQVRMLEPSDDGRQFFEFAARGEVPTGPAYLGGITEEGRVYIRNSIDDGSLFQETDLRPLEEDVVLQFDLIGETLSMWAWRPDQQMPAEPQVMTTDDLLTEGRFGFAFGSVEQDDASRSVALRYVRFDDSQLSPLIEGDFNGNRQLDAADLDLLAIAMENANPDSQLFDANDDGLVNFADRVEWLHEYFVTWVGDTNLDGEFSSTDLVAVLQAGEYEDGIPKNSGWLTGDWNGDSDFTTGDLVSAFADGGYDQGPRAVAMPVPEPGSLLMLTISLLGMAARSRHG